VPAHPAATANYFQAFGIEPRLGLDTESLRETFLALSRETHPDFFATADDAARAESLRRSSLLNNAWKTLRDPLARADYMIALSGTGIESNKNAVPPALLEELFDIQEAGESLREARLSGDEAALAAAEARIGPLRAQVLATRAEIDAELLGLFAEFDAAVVGGIDSPAAVAVLRRIRVALDRMNYLRTVLRNLK